LIDLDGTMGDVRIELKGEFGGAGGGDTRFTTVKDIDWKSSLECDFILGVFFFDRWDLSVPVLATQRNRGQRRMKAFNRLIRKEAHIREYPNFDIALYLPKA
jgi:hypothetical protein